jgi:O-antigen ligase
VAQFNEAPQPWMLRWGNIVGMWLSFMLVTGGLSTPSPLATTTHFGVGGLLLSVSLWRLRHGLPNKIALCAWVLFALGILLIFLQLIPLPPSVWSTLPGRTLISETLRLSKTELPWLPVSLTPQQTASALVSVVPILAGFLAALSMKSQDFFAFALFLVGALLVSVIVGLLQATGRSPDIFFLYGKPDYLSATGFFGNRNFLAALIFSTLPFLAVVATSTQRRFKIYPIIVIGFTLIYMAIMLSGLAVVGSRAGVLLAMPAVLLTLLFVYKAPIETSVFKRSGYATIGVIGTLLVISQASMLGILRLLKSDPLDDFRATIYAVSLKTAKSYWPVGSGFGSFVNVYQIHESPSAIVDRYVNAAHNDWLQFGIEGGVVAALLVIGFVVLFFTNVVRTLRFNMVADEKSTIVRAALVCSLLLTLHGAVDFGLQTPALLSLFAIACGLACLSGFSDQRQRPATVRPKSFPETKEPTPVHTTKRDPAKPFFKIAEPKQDRE